MQKRHIFTISLTYFLKINLNKALENWLLIHVLQLVYSKQRFFYDVFIAQNIVCQETKDGFDLSSSSLNDQKYMQLKFFRICPGIQ